MAAAPELYAAGLGMHEQSNVFRQTLELVSRTTASLHCDNHHSSVQGDRICSDQAGLSYRAVAEDVDTEMRADICTPSCVPFPYAAQSHAGSSLVHATAESCHSAPVVVFDAADVPVLPVMVAVLLLLGAVLPALIAPAPSLVRQKRTVAVAQEHRR